MFESSSDLQNSAVVLGKGKGWKKPILFSSIAIVFLIFLMLGLYVFGARSNLGDQLNNLTGGIFNANSTVSRVNNGEVISESESSPISLQVTDVLASQGRITGKLVLENKGVFGYRDLIYTVSLIGEPVLSSTELNGENVSVMEDPFPVAFSDSELFSLKTGEKKEISLDMAYPRGVSTGLYTLSVSIVPRDEHALAKQVFPIRIDSTGEFLSIVPGTCKLDIDGVKFDSNSGANIDPGKAPLAYCNVRNTTNNTIVAQAEVLQAERYVYGYADSEILRFDGQKTFTFEPGQTERVSFLLPKMVKPQVYEAMGRLIDSQGKPITVQAPFRWVVRGPSAVIKSADMSRHSLYAGDEVEVSVAAAPSVDLFWRRSVPKNYPNSTAYSPDEGTMLQKPRLEVSISSGGEICATQITDLPSNTIDWDVQKIQLKSGIQCNDPVLRTKIYEGEAKLEILEKAYFSNFTNKLLENSGTFKRSPTYLILVVSGSALLIGIVLIIYFSRRGKKKQTPLVGLLILLSLLAAGSVYISFTKVVLGDVIKGPAETEGIPYNQRNVWMERDGRSQGLNFQGFNQVTGGNSTASLNGNSLDVTADIYVISSFGCGNYNLAYVLSVFIDGQAAYVNGGSNNTMLRITRNSNSQQTLATSFNASLPGVDLTSGQHNLEVKLVPVEVYYGGSWQITGSSTDMPQNSGDNNCGVANQGCYGSLKLQWGQAAPAPTFSVLGTTGHPNLTVQLINSSGNVAAQTLTSDGSGGNEMGSYSFNITSPGVYAVRLVTIPAGYSIVGSTQVEFTVIQGTLNGQTRLWLETGGTR